MVESIFQTFLLLAYFDIALLAITIANYAVSASYLGRESRLSRWRIERRKGKLLEKLKELQETPQIESIKREIKEGEAEQRGLGIRIFLLSWLGAVMLPSMFFAISFICSVLGMNSEILSQNAETQGFLEQQLMIFSSGALATGFMILLFVVRTIDSAAKHLPIPEFEVFFEFPEHTVLKTLIMKHNESKKVRLMCHNKGEDIAEDVELFVIFPNTFKIDGVGDGHISRLGTESSFPDSVSIQYSQDIIHVNMRYFFPLRLTAPNATKTYDILVRIMERKIGISDHKLTIKVVD
jgi:hypothetical protein